MSAGEEQPSPVITLPSVRALAATFAAEKQRAFADEMFEFIGAGMPDLRHDKALAHLARGTCLAMVELVLAMMEHAVPADRAEPPVVAVEYACLNAERGLPLADLLRSFRLGHACFARILTDAIMALEQDAAELADAVRESERFAFAVVDVVSSGILAAFLEQHRRIDSRTASQRRDLVRALLDDDDSLDVARAEQSLGHRLTGPQLAFICWSDGDAAAPQRAVSALQDALSAPRPVLLPLDGFALAGWFDMSRSRLVVDAVGAAASGAAPAAHVALGPVLPGLSGFRNSWSGAERVRRVVGLSRRPAPTLTRWADVALVDALSADLDAARALVRDELRGLNRPGDDVEVLRHTAQAFVVSGYSYAAVASSLHIHRNTALQRVRKAEGLRGAPLTKRPAELLAALTLVDVIGAALK